MAALMASSNYSEEALQLANVALSQIEKDARSELQGRRVSEKEILEFMSTVRADLDAQRNDGTSDPVE
jgi:hypothetical protein